MNSVRIRFAQMSKKLINYYRNHSLMRYYKVDNLYNHDTLVYEKHYNKEEFDEFWGVLFSTTADNSQNMLNSNMGDLTSTHTLYTYDLDIDFKVDDRISEGEIDNTNYCYQIIAVDGSIGYLTLYLRGLTWQ